MLPRPVLCLLLVACAAAPLAAQDAFPGLKSVLTPQEWARAGLDGLTPDQVGVIDAALIRHARAAAARAEAEVRTARAQAEAAAAPARERRMLERFGLPLLDTTDWRSVPPLRARVAAWESGNRFRLDNGQVWEGFEPIPYDLPGKEIEIQARPNNQFVLALDGRTTTVRLFRLR
jgi:hypothetical protein